MRSVEKTGFTLIELSIVLVIIGLIIGGVMVGRELIRTSEIRAQLSQIEKYKLAINVFKQKYNALPGDIREPAASGFGFKRRTLQNGNPAAVYPGDGDGNGVIASWSGAKGYSGITQIGETAVVWQDLNRAGIIPGNYEAALIATNANITIPDPSYYFPPAAIGNSNDVYILSMLTTGTNYMGLLDIASVDSFGTLTAYMGLKVIQASDMDKKIDDGFPQTGKVVTLYANTNMSSGQRPSWVGTADTSATLADSTTCYDNGNVAGAVQNYSTAQNRGDNINCALAFQF